MFESERAGARAYPATMGRDLRLHGEVLYSFLREEHSPFTIDNASIKPLVDGSSTKMTIGLCERVANIPHIHKTRVQQKRMETKRG